MSKKSKNKLTKIYSIRAYCSDCGTLLHESVPLTKRQLLYNWDDAVMGATGIKCEKCNHNFPNWHISLKIYHAVSEREFEPAEIIPMPKVSVEEMFAAIAPKKDFTKSDS